MPVVREVTLAALECAPKSSTHSFLKTLPLGFGPNKLGRSPEMMHWLSEMAHSRSVDLIHNHSLWMMPNVYPGRVARKFDIPLIVSPRGTLSEWAFSNGSYMKRLFWPLVQKPALVATSCFHATAASEYEDIRRRGFRQPVAVIPNGIDLPDLPPKMQAGLRTLLFLGRIHEKKGLDMLLPSWGAVQARFPEWRLQIVGPDNGGYLERMQRLATDLSLERIEFTGALLGAQKWHAYRQADLFVLPTYSENFGMSVAESLAAGTPAIVTRGAPWQGLVPQSAGWWIDIGIDPLVACLESALSQSPEALAVMGQRGRDWMVRNYSWQRIGRQMAETYRWVLHGGDSPEWVIED